MLGYTQPNNDIYVFFEEDEIERLETEKIKGTYFNLADTSKTGLLEASVDDSINDMIKVSAGKDDNGFMEYLLLEIRSREYQRLKERRSFELHEGFRHICLIDASHPETLTPFNQLNYSQLRHWKTLDKTLS